MKYRHRKSGAQVEVQDDKVLDPNEWEKDVPARKAPSRKKSTEEDD